MQTLNISTCEPDNNQSFTVKMGKHKPYGFSYLVVRSDGQTFSPFTYKREDAVFVFLVWLQNHEKEMREDMANKRPLAMTNKDWQKHRNATEYHICNKSLVKDLYCDLMAVYDRDSGKYCGQSHRRCYHQAAKNKYALHDTRKPKDEIDKWIANNQETSLFCADPLLVSNFKDSVRDHDHMTGKYHGAAHNDCMTEPENSTNTCLLSQLERLRWEPADASDGEGVGRNKMHTHKHREIHLILTGKSEIC